MTRSQLMQRAKEKGLKRKEIHDLETPELRRLVRGGYKPFYQQNYEHREHIQARKQLQRG